MSRKSIFDILDDIQFDLGCELKKVLQLFNSAYIVRFNDSPNLPLEEFVDIYVFYDWNGRKRCTSIDEFKEHLKIPQIIDLVSRDLPISFTDVLILLEYIENIVFLCDCEIDSFSLSYFQEFVFLKQELQYVLDNLNYECVSDPRNDGVILIEKNAATTAAAEISEPEQASAILRYNHFTLKGDLKAKKNILLELGNDFESYRKSLSTYRSDLVSETAELLNNMHIRHNNRTKPNDGSNPSFNQYVCDMSDEELEGWYDEIYQMLLLCILEKDHMQRKKKIKELKQHLYEKKAEG